MKSITTLSISLLLMVFLFTACGQQGVMSVESETFTAEEMNVVSLEKAGGAFNDYGYNYNAHLFNGSYFNVYAKSAGFDPYDGNDEAYLKANPGAEKHSAWPYRNVRLVMKWNEAWMTRDGEQPENFIGSGAWCTNHQSGGEKKDRWTYFCKIVAVPDDAELTDGIWYTADGTEIGPEIWGAFARVQQVESGLGAIYVSPAGPGLGKW